MKRMIHLIIAIPLLISCTQRTESKIEEYKDEIRKAESNFAELAALEGVPAAFSTYAAEEAVLLRGSKLIQGRDNITPYMLGQFNEGMKLTWSPDFVDVAASGDLGYTYGQYSFTYTDSTGTINESNGYFHTVWKRQPDGQWKFVWD